MAANSEFIEFISKDAYKDLANFLTLIDQGVKKVNDFNAAAKVIKLPSEAKYSIRDMTKETQNQNRAMLEQQKLISRIADAQKKEALETMKLRIELSNLNKERKKEAQEALGVLNAYQKLSAELNELRLEAKGVAAEMFNLEQAGDKNSQKYNQLSSTYDTLSKRVNVLDTGLKKIDADLGQHRRSVGNYALGFSPLNNAISQLAREVPNAGQSFQIFALSISNNIGALQDAISGLIAQNKALIAQGQPVKSVFSQILSGIFSLNTALFVGIAFFTAYSKEIGDFFTRLFSGSKAIDAVKESTEQLNSIRTESLKSITQERVELQNNLAVAKDTTLSYQEREIAAQKVLDQYPYWFENLGKEAIMNGNVEKAVKGVNDALLARAKANAAVGKITENQGKIIDAEEKRRVLLIELNKEEERLRNAERIRYTASRAEQDFERTSEIYGSIKELKNDIAAADKDIAALQEVNNRLLGYSLQQRKESIGLDYEEAKSTEAKTEAAEDYLASQYELLRLRLENEASINERIFNDEATNYERREQALRRYLEIQRELAEKGLAENLRVLQMERDERIKELNKMASEGEITEKNKNTVVFSLQKKYMYDSLTAYENYAEALRQIDIAREQSMKGVWDQINFQKAENLISERDLANNESYAKSLQEIIDKNKDYREIEKATKQFQEASADITKANIQLEIDRIETELRGIKDTEANVQKRLELEGQLAQRKKEFSDADIKEKEEQAQALKKLQQATENYLSGLQSNFLSDIGLQSLGAFLKIEENGKTMLQNLIDGADTAEEKLATVFGAVSQVAIEAFEFINQNQKASFDAQYSYLQQQKEIALKFAGESETARAEIEEQYEERRRAIRNKELKAQKDQLIFQTSIQTASAALAAYASQLIPGDPTSLARALNAALITTGLGLAQVALIASREIPSFWHGTDNHPGGLMRINDAPGSLYREIVETPDGRIISPTQRNAILDAPKGSIVHPAGKFNDRLNAILSQNGIDALRSANLLTQIPNINVNQNYGITKSDLSEVMDKYSSQGQFNVYIDRNGIEAFWETKESKTFYLDNKVRASSRRL